MPQDKRLQYIRDIKKKYKIVDDELAKDFLNEAWFNDKRTKDLDSAASSNLLPWTRKANLAACAGYRVCNIKGKHYDAEPNFTHYYNTIKFKR